MQPPPLDIVGYLDAIERCRHEFPDLRILTGVEFGQPHLDHQAANSVVDLADPGQGQRLAAHAALRRAPQ